MSCKTTTNHDYNLRQNNREHQKKKIKTILRDDKQVIYAGTTIKMINM